jgi:predicted nucleic acid-binding protein
MLLDTSIWIEFLAVRSRALTAAELDTVEAAIADGEVCTVLPIYAELLSGTRHDDHELRALLSSLRFIDLDWRDAAVWERVASLRQSAFSRRVRIPGVVDRMIIAAAQDAGEPIWALDGPLRHLARALGVAVGPR